MTLRPASSGQSITEILTHARSLITSDPAAALSHLRGLLATYPQLAEAHRQSGVALRRLGRDTEAAAAEVSAIRASVHDSELQEAAQALAANALHIAEPILKGRLKAVPTDVAAIRMLAELAARIGRYPDAENLLRRAIELAPAFGAARSNLATVLHKQNRSAEALAELELLLPADMASPTVANLKAAVLGRVGDYEEAILLYEDVLARVPNMPKVWMSYGHTLKTVGRQQDSIDAYRQAATLAPTLGEVWWSLANLKTVRLVDADIAAMEAALEQPGLSDDDRLHLHFALGKALEDRGDAAPAFAHYAKGNDIRHAALDYDPEDTTRQVDRAIGLFTADMIARRGAEGCLEPDPIFILGLPRAGSTLIEQILASHSLVEGTMELPDIPALAARVGSRPGGLDAFSPQDLRALGEDYLARTRVQRKTDKPFFIDKLPNNWAHVGLIRLILPQAKIIDARRHPLDCCFSNFKQHFARGQSFTYDQTAIGRYYADYVRLMRHFDMVMPGHIHRVIHEDVLDHPARETERLLAYLRLPFEDACLRFWETERAVRTASSEQVRRPINRDGVDRWQPFAAWLGPMKDALAGVMGDYRD